MQKKQLQWRSDQTWPWSVGEPPWRCPCQQRDLKVLGEKKPLIFCWVFCHFFECLWCLFLFLPPKQVAHVATRHSCKQKMLWWTRKTLQLGTADGQKLYGFLAACKTRLQIIVVYCASWQTSTNRLQLVKLVQLFFVFVFVSSRRRYGAQWWPMALWWLLCLGLDGAKPWHCFSSCRNMRFGDQSLPSTQWCRLCGQSNGKGLATY